MIKALLFLDLILWLLFIYGGLSKVRDDGWGTFDKVTIAIVSAVIVLHVLAILLG